MGDAIWYELLLLEAPPPFPRSASLDSFQFSCFDRCDAPSMEYLLNKINQYMLIYLKLDKHIVKGEIVKCFSFSLVRIPCQICQTQESFKPVKVLHGWENRKTDFRHWNACLSLDGASVSHFIHTHILCLDHRALELCFVDLGECVWVCVFVFWHMNEGCFCWMVKKKNCTFCLKERKLSSFSEWSPKDMPPS